MAFLGRGLPPARPSRLRLRRRSSLRQFFIQFCLVLRTSVIVLLAILTPLLIAYSLPYLKFLCLDLAPHLWTVYYQLLTPRNLFFLLNFIIVSIVATAHLHRKRPPSQKSPQRHLGGGKKFEAADNDLNSSVASDHVEESLKRIVTHKAETIHPAKDTEKSIISSEEVADVVDLSIECKQSPDLRTQDEEFDKDPSAVALDEETQLPATSLSKPEMPEERKDDFRSHESISADQRPRVLPSSLSSEEGSALRKSSDRPLLSERFTHRKNMKGNADQSKTLGISRHVKKGDTIEATWKAISEGRHPPLNRHLRKIETWPEVSAPSQKGDLSTDDLGKAESLGTPSSPVKAHHPRLRRREPSINQEELNRKVESFISKFNEQIRLQRQESLLQYMQMVDRSAE